jgi:hypothetical protein
VELGGVHEEFPHWTTTQLHYYFLLLLLLLILAQGGGSERIASATCLAGCLYYTRL